MRKITTLLSGVAVATLPAWSQPTFVNQSVLLSNATSSGGCMAVTDMNGDGLDDIAKLDSSRHVYVEYQNPDGSFTLVDYGRIANNSQWGWAIGDVDNNGHKDIFSGAGSSQPTHYLRIASQGVSTLQNLNGPNIFTQCMTMGDLDNDGRVDVFACHDDGAPNIWFTDAGGIPQNNNAYINWSTSCVGTSGDMSGNYGSTWTDFDNDGDLDLHISHCRQGVNDPNDCRRWDRLFVNDGTNHYTDQAAAYGLENHEQVWTTDFGDYDNDGDLDAVSTTHSSTMMLFENDGTGHFTNVTSGSGLEIAGFFLQGLFRDFDNDGFLDIIVGGGIGRYFKGNGDGTFTMFTNVFPATKVMHSFAVGDLNNDGFEDVFASYGDNYVDPDYSFRDRLWMNTPNGNHWFNVRLQGTISNRDAIGARATIYGAWGVQVREVHAGESYGIVNSGTLHFGLGSFTTVDSMVVHWPSGGNESFTNLSANQTMTIVEGTCVSPQVQINNSGVTAICTGGPALTLTASAGSTYLWNTGATTQSISVSQTGVYVVTVDAASNCPGQASAYVVQDPDETPSVAADNATTICQGDPLTLSSSPASSYLWSNGETTQSISITQSGNYSVTITGVCTDWTSDTVDVSVLPTPGAPSANDVFLPAPGTADLVATGDSVVWYGQASGGSPVGYGNMWTTPFLNNTTHFWCEDVLQSGGAQSYGGRPDSSGTGLYHNNGTNYLLFEAYEPFILRSVKVYANGAGNRPIALVDESTGGTVMASGTYNLPAGESEVQLDFNVPAGGPYGLRISSGNPQLWRNGPGSTQNYPYALSTVGAIIGTTVTGGQSLSYYYFFYDWKVEESSFYCTSSRTDVTVDVAVGVGEEAPDAGVRVWPNPTSGTLNISFPAGSIDVDVLDVTGRAVLVRSSEGRVSTSGTMALDMGALAPGEYMLRTRIDGVPYMQRVVVH